MTSPTRLHVESPHGAHALIVEREADRALLLSELLRRHGLPVNTRCGGHGVCEGCLVELTRGSLQDSQSGQPIRGGATSVEVKACQVHVGSPATEDAPTIRIPSRSWTSYQPSVLDVYRINVPFAHQPLCPLPTGTDRTLGLVVDVGTTTVAMMLIDLRDGCVQAKASAFNKQMHLGDDVLTRINLCLNDAGMVDRLQHELTLGTMEPLIQQMLEETGTERRRLAGMTVAGNTTMLHLMAGVDPSPMGIVPFTPRFLEHRTLSWNAIGLTWDETWGDAPAIHLLPGGSAYVGADLVAGMVASGLIYDDGPSLLVDVGTNGEIIFKRGDVLLGCATAAGPAFEGGGLRAGVRAGVGAVSHIHLDSDSPEIHLDIIGETRPIGLCGSAYIDLLARGAARGLIDGRGHFNLERYPEWTRRVQKRSGHSPRFHLGHNLYVSEADIARLMQAKAAIAAGVLTLLDRENVRPRDVKRLYLAGGFGMNVDLNSALGCGLLPGFEAAQVELVGNTSLAGAFITMMDRDMLSIMSEATSALRVLELNLEPGFEDHFIDQLALDNRVG